MKYKQLNNNRYHIKYFMLSFFAIIIISFVILIFVELQVRTIKIDELKLNEERVVDIENNFLGREFSMIIADLHYLHHAYEKQLFDANHYDAIAENWAEFSTHKQIYDQIRYIDSNGDEQIRININENGGYIVADTELQNKKNRYYFYETIKLKEEEVYISPLDLNIEQEVIEEPYKPMIRLSTPIFNDEGELKGIIVLNYLAEYSLSNFRELAQNSRGEIMLLNSKGYWLSSNNQNNDWNFMFEERKEKTFAKEYYEEWEEIKKKENQLVSKNGLFTFRSVLLSDKYYSKNREFDEQGIILGDGNWYIVSVVNGDENSAYYKNDFITLLYDVIRKNMAILILVAIVSGIASYLIYVNRKSYTQIKFYSEYDSLTKSFNRRAGIMRINEILSIDHRKSVPISLCFIDINGLKEVNDILGHKSGDELIVTVSNVIKSTISAKDFLVRLGGDEFLILFHGVDATGAESIWQRIVSEYDKINQKENRPYLISVSHGIVDCNNLQKTYVDDLINAADEKMYQEKQIIKAGLSVIRSQN